MENGNEFCELDYVSWSAPVCDLSDWRYEGVIYRKDQDSINVAVCDEPAGEYQFYGRVQYEDGRVMSDNQPYDPSVICTEEGIFLYFGFAPCMINIPRYKGQDLKGGSVVKLKEDMLTVEEGPSVVIPSLAYGKGTSFEENEYFEGPSIRKINEKYYLVYSSVNTHQLCYAVSDEPMRGFAYGGVIVSNGDVGYQGRREEDKLMSVGNDHGGLVQIEGQWYIFYHRHTYINQYNRQGGAERVYFDENGHIPQVTITTSGMNPGPLSGDASYPAVYCCNLTNGHMGPLSSIGRSNPEVDFPFITSENGERFITNIKDGNLIGYKYIDLSVTKEIEVVYQTDACGQLEIYTEIDGEQRGSIHLEKTNWWKAAGTKVSMDKKTELYFVYRGKGKLSLLTLNLKAQ